MWSVTRLRFQVKINPVKSEIRGIPEDTSVSFVPMEAVGEYGGLRLEQTYALEYVANGYTYFRDGDVVVAKITPCFENGKGSIADGLENGIGFGTTELHVLRPSSFMDRNCLFYLTISRAFRKIGASYMYGAGGQKRVPDTFIRDFRHPIPTTNEQRSIATFLDRETARIDMLIEKKRRQIELLREKRTALISHAVTKGLDPNAKMKDSGIEWLGDIPEHWEVRKLRFCCKSIQTGGTPTSEFLDYDGEDGLDWLTPSDFSESLLPQRSSRRVAPAALSAGDLKMFPTGTVLVVGIGATLGKVGLLKLPSSANQQVNALIPRDDVDSAFLACEMTVLGELLQVFANKATLPILNQQRMGDVPVLVPPVVEQHAIAAFLDRETARIDALIGKVEKSIDLLREHRTALISAAVTGKIDVRKNVQNEQ